MSGRRAVRVGVIDSGWDRSIVDERILPGIGLTTMRARTRSEVHIDGDDQDRVGHGTPVADIILQVAPEARIVPIRVFDATLETSPRLLIRAIDWATSRGVEILNLSLSTQQNESFAALYAACAAASAAGVLLVASGGPGCPAPAIFDCVVGVRDGASAGQFGIRRDVSGRFECVARGHRTARGRGGALVNVAGSSFAAPVVSGQIARYLSAGGDGRPAGVREMLAQMTGGAGSSSGPA